MKLSVGSQSGPAARKGDEARDVQLFKDSSAPLRASSVPLRVTFLPIYLLY